MRAHAVSNRQRRADDSVVKTVLKRKSEKDALTGMRRLRAKGALVNLVEITGFYTRTGRPFHYYEVRQLVPGKKGR